MDKHEFSRWAVAEPENQTDEFLCAKCKSMDNQHMVDEQRQSDEQLQRAMSVDIPEGLVGRILLKQSLEQQRGRRRLFQVVYAIAASMVVAVVILVQVMPLASELDRVVLTHINDELDHLVEDHQVSDATVNNLLQSFGGDLAGPLGPIKYAGLCHIGQGEGIHLVLETGPDVISVLIMPDDYITQRRQISDSRFSGFIIPVAEGSMAVVGEDSASVSGVEERLQLAINWPG